MFGSARDAGAVGGALEVALEERLGFAIPVVVRTGTELAAAAEAHPFAGPESDPRLVMVAFLDQTPTVDIDQVIQAKDYLPDRFALIGREVFLEYPNGSGRSKLNHPLLEQRLGARATIRNMNTLSKLIEIANR